MKKVYPVVLTPAETGYVVYVPDLKINTEGENIANAMEMARDAIGLWAICEEDMGRCSKLVADDKCPGLHFKIWLKSIFA